MRTIVKVDIEHIEYSTRWGSIYESENIAIRNRNITEFGSEHRKAMCTARETQECYVGTRNRIRNRNRNGTKLEMVI